MKSRLSLLILAAMLISPAGESFGDEGMYLFTDLPEKHLKSQHGFSADNSWAVELRLSSVRFNSGGSGSFISSDGLVLTNHHVASDTLHKLSSSEQNLIDDGYLAKSPDKELKAPDLELNQLVSIEDVTDRVNQAVGSDAAPAEAAKQRRAAISEIESESLKKTGFRSDVVTLYGGAKYHLYRYKKYTDVRLVWAPETKAAFFGGDADNFEYPRFCLDATIMRVYEDGKPAKLDHFLRWSDKPVAEGDLVFVSGNPGRTQRIFTTAALKYLRDERLPYILDYLRRKEVLMQQFGLGGVEETRRARDELFGIQNARKAYTGMLAGLQSPKTIRAKARAEKQTKAKLREADNSDALKAWQEIAEVQKEKAKMLGKSVSLRSQLYDLAITFVLKAAEDAKPNGERLREFNDAGRESLLQELNSEAPIYDDLERAKLADEIARLVEFRGADSELAKKVLDGKSPRDRAAELVAGTKLQTPDGRKSLIEGDQSTIENSSDTMIQFARVLENEYRAIREINEELSERERQAYAKITKAKTAIEGTSGYPDATFTLRLAFGVVKSYEQDGETIPPATDFAGGFAHADSHEGQKDFDLPKSYYKAKDEIDLSTQLNFVCTADIIGGNSGSPVVDRNGKLVGLIFDGNIQSLTSDYLYTDTQARAVSVSGVGILEALRSIYGAKELADSIGK